MIIGPIFGTPTNWRIACRTSLGHAHYHAFMVMKRITQIPIHVNLSSSG